MPGTQMTSIFEGQPPKTRPFPIKTRVIWVPGVYMEESLHVLYICNFGVCYGELFIGTTDILGGNNS